MNNTYDCVIVGGGLAGLTFSIQLAKAGYSVVLVEKDHFPFHKVCGEYVSMESHGFLIRMGFPIEKFNLPSINKFSLTHANGRKLNVKLPLGGFGVSRYLLDDELANVALQNGVILLQGTQVENVLFDADNQEHVVITEYGELRSKTAIGAYGKRSKLDKTLKRPFIASPKSGDQNFVGIKYHVKAEMDPDQIELHLFEKGYAGISRVENGKSCFCYLINSSILKSYKGDINAVEREVLAQNPYLKERLQTMEKLFKEPVTISQIEFGEKEQVVDHILMAGDSAGMITPLTGNGMSMALLASKIAYEEVNHFLSGKCSREQMELNYQKRWNREFKRRLARGRLFQSWFFNPGLSSSVMAGLKWVPPLARAVVKSTHGKPF